MTENREADRQCLLGMEKEKLIELLLLHIRNLWAVDGLYFLGIEEKFGTEEATKIDTAVWKTMASTEVRRLKKAFNLNKKGVAGVVEALRLTGWALDLERKEIRITGDEALLINHDCRVQKTRLSKGLTVFPCKSVRLGYMEQFVKEVDPDINVECVTCPPDDLPENVWCSWKFKPKDSEEFGRG